MRPIGGKTDPLPQEKNTTEIAIGFSPDVQMLASALRPALGLEAAAGPSVTPELARFAMQRHRVGPLLHKACQLAGEGDTPAAEALHASYARNVRGHLRHRALMQKFTRWLALRGHCALPVKGWELGAALHGESALRYSKDIDLLIGPEAMDDALAIAAENGFVIAGKRGEPGLRKAGRLTPRFKEVGVVDPELQVQIELHSRLLVRPPAGWQDADPSDAAWPRLSNPDYVLYLVIHGAWTYWNRMKWLCDLAMLAQRVDDAVQAEVAARARQIGCEQALVAGLQVVGALWEQSIVQSWLEHTQASHEDALVAAHRNQIIERLNQMQPKPFAQRMLGYTQIVRNPPVFGAHPPRLHAMMEAGMFWFATKL